MDEQASPQLVTYPEGASLASVPVAPLVPAEAPSRTPLEAVGDAVYKLTHHGDAPQQQPAEALPVVTLPAAEAVHGSHVAALGERRPTTAEAIASAMLAVDAASHALKVAARSASEEGQGRGV